MQTIKNTNMLTSKEIKPGQFVSVKLCYGNHFENVVNDFLGNGWAIQYNLTANYEKGEIYQYITFVAGVDAVLPEIDYANARII